MLKAIFEPFVQQRQALDRASGGLGLGLTIGKNLVSLHGGTVRAASEALGKGTEFIVDLPLGTPESEAAAFPEAGARPAPRRGNGARVLVVDDNRDAAGTLAELLRTLDYDVQIAYDAASALQLARQFEPRFALLDIGLPQVDGYELGRQIASLAGARPRPRLVAITGYGQEADKLRSAAAGFATHIVKPVQLEAVIAALDPDLPSIPRV
jgi:CheY-like chemotaxis protein